MNVKTIRYGKYIATFALAAACLGARASDWIGGVGDWSSAANWAGGVPDNTGGWAIGSVTGGTAVVSTTIPHVSEAWAGNYGGAGTIIVTNGGTLSVDNWLVVARMCCPSPSVTPLSTLIIDGGVVNKTGNGFIVGDSGGGLGSLAQMIVGGNTVVNITGGWTGIGSGADSRAWVYLQGNSVYNTPAYDFNIADYGAAKVWCYIKDNATLNASRFWIGKSGTTVGTLWQTGGTINGTGTAANEWTIGGDGTGDTGSFGYYDLAGGLISVPFNFQVGRYGGGVLYQTGGTNIQSGWTSIARFGGSLGVVWLSGGQFSHRGTSMQLLIGEGGLGTFTVSGAGALDSLLKVRLGNPGGTGFLSLNGGSATVPGFVGTGGNGYLNLNGGVVKATQNDPAFISALNEARIYPGNAIFDTAGYDITISQALLGASGQGVVSIPVADGGQGYMAPPIVTIDGDGFGALAVAQIHPGAGTVTNIVVTCPGHDYSTVYTVTLTGGGATVPAIAGAPVLAAIASGGLVKNGAGTLALLGQNTYTGPTTVNAGKLVTTANTTGTASYTVADGAALGVTVQNANMQLNVGSVTLGSATGASLDLDLGNFGNPLLAPLYLSGALAVNGTVTINIADALPQVGQFPLVQFGSRTGSGTVVLGTLPVGLQASLVSTANAIELHITAVNLPRWDGQAGGFWDINVTTNWADISTGLPAFYGDGNAVVFDDSAVGTTTVNLVTNVHPASILVNNTNLNYTLIGTGKISGATGLLKQGAGSLTLANSTPNEYTGPTTLAGGTLSITNLANGGQPSALGKSSSASTNLVLAGGTLSYSGPAVSVDRGYRVEAAGSAIEVQSDLGLGGKVTAAGNSALRKRGSAKLTYNTVGTNELSGGSNPGFNVLAGTVVFDGSAGHQTNHSQAEFWVGTTPDVPGSLVLTNTSLYVDSWLAIGRGNGSSGTVSTLSVADSKLWSGNFSMGYDAGLAGNLASQVMTISGNSTFTNRGDWNFGESGGSASSLTMKDNSIIDSGRFFIGWHSSASGSGTGAVAMANSSLLHVNGWLSIGNEGGLGTMLMKDNSRLDVLWDLNVTDVGLGDGTLTIQDNAQVVANQIYVAKGIGSTGVFNQSGGTVTARGGGANEFQIGVHGPGTWNQTGGTVNANGNWTSIGRYTDGTGVLNISGGSFNHNDPTRLLQVGEQGFGTLNVSGSGLVTTIGSSLYIANASGSSGTVNLNGGTIIAKRVGSGGGASIFNFNGGMLAATPGANLDFMSGLGYAYVQSGGAIINSSNNIIAISQPLLDGGGNGGLTKLGSGALALNGVNTYTGPTLVNAGALGGTGVISGPVTIAAGAYFAPGAYVGTLSISNTLTLAAGSVTIIEIDKANSVNDLVQGLTTVTYGGILRLTNLSPVAVNDAFKILQAGSYSGSFSTVLSNPGTTWDTSRLSIDGTVKVLSTVSTTPPTVGVSTAGGGTEMVFSWPLDHTGWRLLAQTNNLNLGVSPNLADWGTVSGSSATNQVYLPIDKSKPAGYYRLVYP